MRILNLFAGIGGNRKNWKGVEVVAVEKNETIANCYAHLFPEDTIIVGDAHQYLLEHFRDFDFIWSSPPCQTHSSFRQNFQVKVRGVTPVYPDMQLYQEIIFLRHNAQCQWVVENVKPYYTPLIQPSALLQRHYFWANFTIKQKFFEKSKLRHSQIQDLQKYLNIYLDGFKLPNKRQILRNCVHPIIGEHILKCTKQDIV